MSTPCPTCRGGSSAPRISHVVFSAAPRRDIRSGLLGFVAFDFAGFRFDGVAVRRTRDGRLVLSFPERTDSRGNRHAIVRPLDARRQIEDSVFRALGLDVNRDDRR